MRLLFIVLPGGEATTHKAKTAGESSRQKLRGIPTITKNTQCESASTVDSLIHTEYQVIQSQFDSFSEYYLIHCGFAPIAGLTAAIQLRGHDTPPALDGVIVAQRGFDEIGNSREGFLLLFWTTRPVTTRSSSAGQHVLEGGGDVRRDRGGAGQGAG